MKISKNTLIAAVVILCLLAAAWLYGDSYAGKTTVPQKPASMVKAGQDATPSRQTPERAVKKVLTSPASSENTFKTKSKSGTVPTLTNPKTGHDQYLTDPLPSGKPRPVEPQKVQIADTAHTCTLSVVCATILNNMKGFNPDKREMLPADGIIFKASEVTFYDGESVFNVLQREMKKAGIQMEFAATPIYNSNYIEGINNIYEFDCGELSGWMYQVNGWFPNYGCSRYQLKDGDAINWVYTCNLGRDVGGDYSANKGGGR